jgi:cytochrome c biogenesis factor
MEDHLGCCYGTVRDQRGSTLEQLLHRRIALVPNGAAAQRCCRGKQTVSMQWGNTQVMAEICHEWKECEELVEKKFKKGTWLLNVAIDMGAQMEGEFFAEAEFRFVTGANEQNIFSLFAAELLAM